ncbi:alpha-2Da adrenergic receptor-like [Paramacrobiotus metropolitanus]|uniref:alpha-2Da adrenergic receptor-like n=1 Tax=Paramacrobiotus metropolitanus TaxID=2943436 RepID=UPI0024463DF4|nr:alpha-2Da adrenergic receptor-like [Paramacrobiotus metropolitanus]
MFATYYFWKMDYWAGIKRGAWTLRIDNKLRRFRYKWRSNAVAALIMFILALITNTVGLLLFAVKFGIAANSFNIYIISLLTANILYPGLGSVLDVINDLFSVWFLGWSWCTVYLYIGWTIPTVQIFMHLVITVNRGCAAAFPIRYRQYHSQRVAVALSAGAWLAGHTLVLPGIILDATYYRLSTDETVKICHLDASVTIGQKTWMMINLFTACAALFIIVAMFPYFLYVKHRSRKKVHHNLSTISRISRTHDPPSAYPAAQATRLSDNETFQEGYRKSNKSIVLLTTLTTSLFLFWTPSVVFFALVPFQDEYNDVVGNVCTILLNCQHVLDPILFALALRERRHRPACSCF